MRHAMMGERRLLAYGFEIGVDVPMVPDHWVGVCAPRGLEAMLFVVHGLEQGGPKWKAMLKEELWRMGDPYSSQDCHYDWANEAGRTRSSRPFQNQARRWRYWAGRRRSSACADVVFNVQSLPRLEQCWGALQAGKEQPVRCIFAFEWRCRMGHAANEGTA
jgi:hypothetical protein